MTYTFSDGLTLAGTNVTNDLVTGASVPSVTVNSAGDIQLLAGGASGILLDTTGGGSVLSNSIALLSHLALNLQAQEGASALNLDTNVDLDAAGIMTLDATALLDLKGSGIRIVSKAASQLILGSGANTLLDAGGAIQATAGGSFSFTADAASAGGFVVTTDGVGDVTFNASHDEIHTVGRNLTMVAQGSGGASLSAEIGNLTLAAGTVDNTGEVRISPTVAAPAAGLTFRIWNGAGASQQTVTSPGGGATVDAECRAQLGALLTAFFNLGFLTDPNP